MKSMTINQTPDNQAFLSFLEKASQMVEKMPAWQRDNLKLSSLPTKNPQETSPQNGNDQAKQD